MNGPHPVCPWEDAAVAAFVDGDPHGAGDLAAHVAGCEVCQRAVNESRRLDSLLAAQTDTDLGEGEAAGLLSFLAAPRPAARSRPAALAAAACLVLAASLLWLAWFLSSRERSAIRVAAPAVASAPGLAVLAVPDRVTALPRPATMPIDEGELRAAFLGRWTVGLPPARLGRLAEEILAGALDRASRPSAPLAVDGLRPLGEAGRGPLRAPGGLVLAAARWQLAQVGEGALRSREALGAARVLLAAEGLPRRDLVSLFRAHRSLLAALGDGLERRGAGQEPIGFAVLGAVGHRVKPRVLARLPLPVLAAGVFQARRTGDRACLEFVIDACLAVSLAGDEEIAAAWLEDLPPRERSSLLEVLGQRIAMSRRLPDRDELRRLQARLGAQVLLAGSD